MYVRTGQETSKILTDEISKKKRGKLQTWPDCQRFARLKRRLLQFFLAAKAINF